MNAGFYFLFFLATLIPFSVLGVDGEECSVTSLSKQATLSTSICQTIEIGTPPTVKKDIAQGYCYFRTDNSGNNLNNSDGDCFSPFVKDIAAELKTKCGGTNASNPEYLRIYDIDDKWFELSLYRCSAIPSLIKDKNACYYAASIEDGQGFPEKVSTTGYYDSTSNRPANTIFCPKPRNCYRTLSDISGNNPGVCEEKEFIEDSNCNCGSGKKCLVTGVKELPVGSSSPKSEFTLEYTQYKCVDHNKKCENSDDSILASNESSCSSSSRADPPQIDSIESTTGLSFSLNSMMIGVPLLSNQKIEGLKKSVIGASTFRSIYTIGRTDQPDYICQSTDGTKWYPHLFCHKQGRNFNCLKDGDCKCQDESGTEISDTACKFTRADPLRFQPALKPNTDKPGKDFIKKKGLSTRMHMINIQSY